MGDFVTVLAVGMGGGIIHAFDADHVVAVSTLLHKTEKLGRILRIGVIWGLGHTTTLLGGVLIIKSVRAQVSEAMLGYFELPVAVMLIVLGVRAAYNSALGLYEWKSTGRDGSEQSNYSNHRSKSLEGGGHSRFGWQSYAVGMVHGLAGSGALVLTVSATLSSLPASIAYVSVFGVGSILGMSIVTGALSVPFLGLVERVLTRRLMIISVGLLSVGLGVEMLTGI